MSDNEWVDDQKLVDDGWVDDAPIKPALRPIEAGLEGLGQGATLGYGNELAAALEQVTFPVASFLTGQDVQADPYIEARDKYAKRSKQLELENPNEYLGGQIAGGLASAIATSPLTAVKGATAGARALNAAKIGAATGAIADTEGTEGKIDFDLIQRAKNAALGGAIGGLAQGAIDSAPKAINSIRNKAGNYLKDKAELLAENATGATRTQAEKFAPNAGRELLDRKLVRFGDSAESIAQRTGAAVDAAGADIDEALKALDAKGVTASVDNIVAELESKIAKLKGDPSQSDVVRKLENIVLDITETGSSNIPISAAEKTKRGFNRMSKNWQDPEKGQAGKAAYLTYMDEVEKTANAADQNLASKFKEGKETFGLLAPIQEAAEKRATTLNQSPFGGLLDTAAGAYGLSDPDSFTGKAALAIAGRRFIAPRIGSSLAVSADKISKALLASPQMAQVFKTNPAAFQTMVQNLASKMEGAGVAMPRAADSQQEKPGASYKKEEILNKLQGSKYAQVLQNAAQKGDQQFNAANYVLQQRDPEYRKLLNQQGGQ